MEEHDLTLRILVNHIQKGLSQGHSIGNIKKLLLDMGYAKERIEEAFKLIKEEDSDLHKDVRRRSFQVTVERLLLAFLIVVAVLDYLKFLPGDIEVLEHILDWTAICYIFYRASFSRILFGKRSRAIDLALLFSFLLVQAKTIIQLAVTIVEEVTLSKGLFELIISSRNLLNFGSFALGTLALLLFAIVISFRVSFIQPSLLAALHENERPKTVIGGIFRGFVVFWVFLTFYMLIFNPIMEWIGLTVHSPLVIIGVFYYFMYAKRLKSGNIVYKAAAFGEEFLEKFISLFHYRKTIFLGLFGLLGLHLLVDVSTFVLPYLFGNIGGIYFTEGSLDIATHYPLYKLFLTQIGPWYTIPLYLWVYLGNLLMIIFSFVMPAYIWRDIYTREQHHIPRWVIVVYYFAFVCFMMTPIFVITPIDSPELQGIAGVDIMTTTANGNLPVVIAASALALALAFILSSTPLLRRILIGFSVLSSLSLVGYYIYSFTISDTRFFLSTLSPGTRMHLVSIFHPNLLGTVLFDAANYFTSVVLSMMMVITVAFYTGSFLIFIWNIFKEFRKEA